jgi:hypothetical integral membrane protein (TIGR02206 family)
MEPYFTRDWTGEPFALFGTGHLIALAIVLLVNLSFIFFRRAGERPKRIFRYTLAGILIVDEIAWHLWNIFTDQWTVQTMLPFHFCSVFVFLSAYMLVKKNYRVYEFAYFLGIAGALQPLLTPDAGMYGLPHFRAVQTLLSHGCIVTASVYMTVVEGFRPTWKSMRNVLIGANLYMIPVGILNALIGSNYLFIAHKPETASLIDVLGPWPWYILSLEVIGAIMCLILYLPFWVRDRRANALARPQLSLEQG